MVNHVTVSGNLNEAEFTAFMKNYRTNMISELYKAKHDYGIKSTHDIENIRDTVCDLVHMFLSRTKNDKEREHRNKQYSTKEVYGSNKDAAGVFGLFRRDK